MASNGGHSGGASHRHQQRGGSADDRSTAEVLEDFAAFVIALGNLAILENRVFEEVMQLYPPIIVSAISRTPINLSTPGPLANYPPPYVRPTRSNYVFSGMMNNSNDGRSTQKKTRPSSQSRHKKKNKEYGKHPQHSEEAKEKVTETMMEDLLLWANGDQDIVDRTRVALKDNDDPDAWLFKGPCSCGVRFPTQEWADLHALNAPGTTHSKYRVAQGLPPYPRHLWIRRAQYQRYEPAVPCPCCQVAFQSQRLVEFHLRNAPDRSHWKYRKNSGMEQEWDKDDRELFPCPVCKMVYSSKANMEHHLLTQSGRAHRHERRMRPMKPMRKRRPLEDCDDEPQPECMELPAAEDMRSAFGV